MNRVYLILLHQILPLMISKNISLKEYNTFGLDYNADMLITFNSEDELITTLKENEIFNTSYLIVGGGSNLLFTENFRGTILHSHIGGIKIEESHPEYIIVSAGAGVIWDRFIEWCVVNGYGGLENLSSIPGTVGATPVQNIGAYGIEVKDSILKVRTISLKDFSIREFSNNECKFSYRNSIFKNTHKGCYFVTRVYFQLKTNQIIKTDYGSLNEEIKKLGPVSLRNIRQAVINIRTNKLPDPEKLGNAGSFFKNPVVKKDIADSIIEKYPDIPFYSDQSGDIKFAAGWMIDKCGWKGKRIGNAGVHEKQALVIVNYGNAKGKEIFNLSEDIRKSVLDKFGIKLEREVEVIGSI
jgi:UDP-N-acetylmuramate dehydrogenase